MSLRGGVLVAGLGLALIAFVIVMATVLRPASCEDYAFSQANWARGHQDRVDEAERLVECGRLRDRTEDETRRLLGPESDAADGEFLIWDLASDGTALFVRFSQSGESLETTIQRPSD